MLLLLYEEQRQPSSFTVLVSISSTRTHLLRISLTVQLLQILTHTLVVARQLYDFQLPVILPLDTYINHAVVDGMVVFRVE
jgi:hypothetical protein